MKKIFLIIFLLPFLSNAQVLGGNNVIKANLSSLAFGNYHLTYERALLKKLSISVSYRYMPKKTVPLSNLLEKYIDNKDVNFGSFEMGNTAITPELRLYPVKKLKGFYLAAYGRFADFDLSVPVRYVASSLPGSPTEYATFNGKIKSSSIGFMIGTQFRLAKKLVLDWWIIGGHYGRSKGDLNALINRNLSPIEQQSLQATLDDLKEIGPFKFEGKVTSPNTANVKSTGPWAGVRSMGLSLGVRF
ncbi:MAG TPA: DUF3575 domain-containing protein [Chitinophagaceae bacterium]|nr:DUF3575 domain-containing protein [Chitinophagaceae bacterium]HNM35243.1 DUF3575 domain-containing protein [Chitinophagaceae bacterium]HNN31334.1 DUF3575 domain-containing protein [Chitinophagaceae bacterium]